MNTSNQRDPAFGDEVGKRETIFYMVRVDNMRLKVMQHIVIITEVCDYSPYAAQSLKMPFKLDKCGNIQPNRRQMP